MTRVARSRGRATAPLNRPLLRYRAFGLALASELELDELSGGHADDPVDLTIRLLPNDHVSELNEAPVSFRLGATECVMAWEAVGRFRPSVIRDLIAASVADRSAHDDQRPIPSIQGLLALLYLGAAWHHPVTIAAVFGRQWSSSHHHPLCHGVRF